MEQRDFKGVWIPKQIWNKIQKKELALFVAAFHHNRSLLSTTQLNRLKSEGLLVEKNLPYKEAVNLLKDKRANNYGDLHCEWCGSKVFVLHQHHYPMKKCDGGKETVNICPNCHYEYHYLTESRYELADFLKNLFEAQN
tara:strand:+ start:152 stop:568 length:417 start_codon:yes stop_codon:yes gene_type:complete